MKHLVFSILLAAALAGCKKNKGINYTIQGNVTDLSYSGGASGVIVDLYQVNASGELTIAQSTTTGSDGSYTFTVKRDRTEGFKLTFTKAHYFSEEQSFTLESLDAKNPNTFNEAMYAKGWIRLRFQNINPDESISVVKNEGLSGCTECCPFTSLIFNGTTDTSFVCLNKGGLPYSVKWSYIPGTQYFTPSVIAAPIDTTDLIVNF